jgi:site-specific recombinase XerD
MSRHTYATTLITLGADVFTVQKLLGHKSIQTTQVYAELVGKKKREAVNLLDKVIAGDYGTYE